MKSLTCMAWLLSGSSAAMLAQAEKVSETVGVSLPVAEFTAMAALIATLFFLLKVYIPSKDKEMSEALKTKDEIFTKSLDKINECHDYWERLRHEDSQKLTDALHTIKENCAAVQTRLSQHMERNDGK